MTKLENNGDLRRYLSDLGTKLAVRGAEGLSEAVFSASQLAWTFPSTEFLGESRIALRSVQEQCPLLNDVERLELADVLEKLDGAFRNRR